MKIIILITTILMSSSVLASKIKFDRNVPKDVKNQMLEDLEFMKTISGNKVTPLHKEIFGEMNGENYLDFFYERIRKVGLSNCGSSNAVACVYIHMNKKMFITSNYIKFSHPQIARLMIVYHEARHAEKPNYWGHATCPSPFLDREGNEVTSIWTGSNLGNEPACDITPYGSYGSSTILLKNISMNCSNCNEKVKMDAEIYAQDQLKRVISDDAYNKMLIDFNE